MFDLAFVWAGLIAFAVLAYVLFDGFDLGIGILFPLLAAEEERDQAMNSVVLPALYAPIIAMLLGLIFRGVAFEFRFRSRKRLWDWAFAAGSTIAALAQGIALGALVQGIPISVRA